MNTYRRSSRALAVALLAFCFGGCSSGQHPSESPIGANDPVALALSESAQRVARAAEQAALAQSLANKRNRVTEEYSIDLARLPSDLRDPLLLEGGFNGELEIFIRSVADAIGWPAPMILGNRPSTPLMVSFTEQRRPPAQWLADAGYQVGAMAKVSVNPNLRQIVIRYSEAGGVR